MPGGDPFGSVRRIAQDHQTPESLPVQLRVAIASGRENEAQRVFLKLQVSEERNFALEGG